MELEMGKEWVGLRGEEGINVIDPSYFCTSWYKQTKAVITEGKADSF